MDCAEFEREIEQHFRHVETGPLLAALEAGDRTLAMVPDPAVRAHLAECPVCVVTLNRYLPLRERIRLSEHPCLHLALETAEGCHRVAARLLLDPRAAA